MPVNHWAKNRMLSGPRNGKYFYCTQHKYVARPVQFQLLLHTSRLH